MSKVNKKVLDAELSSSEEEVVVQKKVVKAAKKQQVAKDSEESSDDSIVVMKSKTQRKGSDKEKAAPAKKQKRSEDKAEEKPKKKAPVVKPPVKKEESSDEESSDEDVKPKKTQAKVIPAAKLVPAKKAPLKKEESSEDEDSDDEEEEVKPKVAASKVIPAAKLVPAKKFPAKKKESSDDDDDDEEEEEVKPKVIPGKKAPVKKQESSDEDSEEEDVKPKVAPKKAPAKKEDSDSEEEEEAEEPIKPVKKAQEIEKPQQSAKLPENAFEELFVRNLSYNTTEESLANHMAKYGDIELVKIITDKMTQKSKGFGFVKFYEKASAVAAVNDAGNINVDGREIQIRYSNDDSQRQNQSRDNNPRNSFQKSNYAGEKHAIFVGNLSFKTNENNIKKFFSDCGNVVDVRIAKQPDGKMKGFAHVDFESGEAVDNALKKNGVDFEGRQLKVDKSTPRQGGGGGNFRGRDQGGYSRGGFGGGDSLSKAKKTGAMIMPTESKAVDLEEDDDQ